MHVDISPRRFTLTPGRPEPITVTVANTGTVIGGYAVRVLGADPSWVDLPDSEFSLFPEESRQVVAQVTVPYGMTAGERRFAIQVRELTPPEASIVEEVAFTVPDAKAMHLRVDPMVITAGRTAKFSLLIDNTGNTQLDGRLHGQDAEGKVTFTFAPEVLDLAPGEHAVVDMAARARRPFTGSPVVRLLDLHVVDPSKVPPPPPSSRAAKRQRKAQADGTDPNAGGTPLVEDDQAPLANATFVQRSVLTRGTMSLLGLLAAISIFALVITLALSQLVGQSAADRNLALEIAAARDAGAGTGGSSGASGTVRLLTSGTAVPGVGVSIFAADDTETPLASTATDADGSWRVGQLPAGDYKVNFQGAGFVQMWFPQALEADDAETITLEANNRRSGLDVSLGGVPASIAGKVVGEDPSAATLTLRMPLDAATAATSSTSAVTAEQGAAVKSVPVGADGTFALTDVPSPSVYDLVVEKPGYATSTQRIDVSAGEERAGVEITLRKGDGVISGTVNSASAALAKATITVTSGQTSVTTMSVSEGDVGSFAIRGLPTPATFTVVASLAGYASQTLTLTLAEGQRLTGVSLTLNRSAGELSGMVLQRTGSKGRTNPAAGVLVTVTDGQQTVQTATQSSADIGTWRASGLAVPGTYTVTFSRGDLASQTLSVALDGSGNITSGGQGSTGGGTAGGTALSVTMNPSTATVYGTVEQRTGAAQTSSSVPVGEVIVQLSSGSASYTVTTASEPSRWKGRFRIDGIPPGTYTISVSRGGVSPTSEIMTLAAGQIREYNPPLAAAASVRGTVVANGQAVAAGWVVELFRASDYPGSVYLSTTTSGTGQFEFPDVDAPEAYVIQVRRTRGSAPSGSSTFQLETSEQMSIRVRVRIDG